jgi:hypothetical protein
MKDEIESLYQPEESYEFSGPKPSDRKKDFERRDPKKAIFEFSNYLIDKFKIKTVSGTRKEIYVYSEGCYVPGEDMIRKEIRNELKELAVTQKIKEILETVKDKTSISKDNFITPLNLINLQNGTLDIENMEFVGHSDENLFLSKIPVEYNAESVCPKIEKFLSQILEPEQISVILEWFGFCLYRHYIQQEFLKEIGFHHYVQQIPCFQYQEFHFGG